MPSKRSPLSSNSKSKTKVRPHAAPLATDYESIEERRIARETQDLDSVNLEVLRTNSGGKTFRYSFQRRASSSTLVRQCLYAADLSLKNSDVSLTTIQNTYYGVSEFLDFCESGLMASANVNSVADIDFQVGKEFCAWLLVAHPGREVNRKRYGKVKEIISLYKIKFEGQENVGTRLAWPKGPPDTPSPTQSYTSDDYNKLADAALKDVKEIQQIMDAFERGLKNGRVIFYKTQTIPDVCKEIGEWEKESGRVFKYSSDADRNIASRSSVQFVASNNNITPEEFVKLYRSKGDELSISGYVFPKYSIVRVGGMATITGMSTIESWGLASRTFRTHLPDWPLRMTWRAASDLVSHANYQQLPENCYIAYRVLQNMRLGDSSNPFDVGLLAYIGQFFFTSSTLYPFFLLVQLNTGWNEEAVRSLSRNLDDHVEPDLIDPDYVLIRGWKNRTEQTTLHRSHKKFPFSTYSILRFVAKVLDSHLPPIAPEGESLWQYVRSKNLWPKNEGSVLGALGGGAVKAISSEFLSRHEIVLDENYAHQSVDARRMRTTVQTRRRENGLSIDESSLQMGHADMDTTARHYDADVGSIGLKNHRLRALQADLVNDLSNYRANLVQSVTLQDLRRAIRDGSTAKSSVLRASGLKRGAIIHLLSPAGQTYIAACADRKNPTWPRAHEFLSGGDSCNFFNKCCLCDQSHIFLESLPFIFRRQRDLDSFRLSISIEEWGVNFAAEYDAWDEILKDWNNREAVRKAEIDSYKVAYTLPRAMRGPTYA